LKAHLHNRVARLESKAPDPAIDVGWVRIIVNSDEDQERAQERYFAEHSEDRAKNVILRVIV